MIKICLKTKRKKDIQKDSDAKIVLEKKIMQLLSNDHFRFSLNLKFWFDKNS